MGKVAPKLKAEGIWRSMSTAGVNNTIGDVSLRITVEFLNKKILELAFRTYF